MPKYRFDFDGETGVQPVYVELPDLEAAKKEALKSMAESIMDLASERRDPTKLKTKLYDEAGYHLATVNFGDVAGASSEFNSDDATNEPDVMRSG